MRLRQALIARGLAPDEKKAEGLILAGQVLVNDVPITKPGTDVADNDIIRIRGLKKFVSRAGKKLDAAVEYFRFPVADRGFLDIGASTGGFSDALLMRGACYVAAIDVGKGLLHQKLRSDARVQVLEGEDFKALERGKLRQPAEAFVADVSFASLEAMIPKAFSLITPTTRAAEGIVLFKPQFELPKAERNLLQKGVLDDREKSRQLLADFKAKLASQGITVEGETEAALKGAKGNQEYLLHISRQ